jgi:hypothetical protein
MKIISIFSLLLIFSSCASNRHRWMTGTVAMKFDEKSGVACLEPGIAKVGRKLKFLNNDCSRENFPDIRGSCKLIESGELQVTKLLNDHYAEFVKISGTAFREGSIIGAP